MSDRSVPLATWWAAEKARDFTKLECGLLGALFASVAVGFLVVVGAVLA